MFNPSREQVRRFFIDTWQKYRAQALLSPLESMAVDIIAQHPEYHGLIESSEAVVTDFAPEDGLINPFLHLSLHLAVEEQLSIDQPAGIRAAFAAACTRCQDRHDAMHEAVDCLGAVIAEAQRRNAPLDAEAYLATLRRERRH